MRTRVSIACACAGVLLVLVASLLPERLVPAIPLFSGLALLAAAHILTPCRRKEGRI